TGAAGFARIARGSTPAACSAARCARAASRRVSPGSIRRRFRARSSRGSAGRSRTRCAACRSPSRATSTRGSPPCWPACASICACGGSTTGPNERRARSRDRARRQLESLESGIELNWNLAAALAQPARLPLLGELGELARELLEGLVEGEDDLGGGGALVAGKEAAGAGQGGEGRLRHLERAALALIERVP